MFMILEVAALVLAACDPTLAGLFTPRHPQLGHYEVCTTPQPIEVAAGPSATIEVLDPLDAFGAEGDYDRSRLARLYAGTRARVARTWKEADGRFESDTFISPYPDASLSRLESGTMEVRWTYLFTSIATSPLTTSIDSTGSPVPSVVSPNRGPN